MVTEIKDVFANRLSVVHSWLVATGKVIDELKTREDIRFTELEKKQITELIEAIQGMSEYVLEETKKVL